MLTYHDVQGVDTVVSDAVRGTAPPASQDTRASCTTTTQQSALYCTVTNVAHVHRVS